MKFPQYQIIWKYPGHDQKKTIWVRRAQNAADALTMWKAETRSLPGWKPEVIRIEIIDEDI